jgi:8-oxo-dGTP pyrophosphatase MutT (NUDIX family)
MREHGKTVTPRKAMTIILLRELESTGFEVFLLKRHEQSIFMGGNFVYPGGKLDRGDSDSSIIALSTGISDSQAQYILGEANNESEGLAYWIAGIRELFEEAGILLAYTKGGKILTIDSDGTRQRFALHRKALQKGETTLLQILREEDLTLALDRCFYFAHWVTPEARNVRFDTRFFIARHIPGQEASHDAKETTEGVWMTPAEALQKNLGGIVALSPPTLKTLEDLSRFKTIDDVISALPGLEKPTILPILLNPTKDEVLIFPWDPEYEGFRNGELSQSEDHGSLSGPTDSTTRLVLKDGRWLPYMKTSG